MLPVGVLAVAYWVLLMSPTAPVSPPAGSTSLTIDDARTLVERTQALIAEHRYKDALVPMHTLFQANPTNHIYAGRLAEISNHLGRFRDEAVYWEQFVRYSPNPIEACPQIGDAYWKQGLAEESVEAFERCAGFESDNADALFYLARAYERTQQYDAAERSYRRGMAMAPEYLDMRHGLARLDLLRGQTTRARTAAMRLLTEAPNDVDALLIAGLAFQREGNRREAKKYLERGVGLEDTYADFHLALGVVAEEEHDDREAMSQYVRTLALDGARKDALARRDRLAARMANHD